MSIHTDSTDQLDISQPGTSQKAAGPSGHRRRPGFRPPRWVLAVGAAVAVAAAALALPKAGNVSIVSGWFPVVLFWVTVAACVTAVMLRRDVLREFAIGIPVGIVFAVLLFVTLTSPRRSPPARRGP